MQTIFTDTLEQAFAQAGLDMPKINGSKIARFSTNGKNGDTAGWLRLFDDSTGAAFGDWRTGESWCWQQARDTDELDQAERDRIRAKAQEQKRLAEEERQREYEAAAVKAKEIVADCAPATAHPYLEDKHISASGALFYNDKLVIPVYGQNGIQSFQSIDAKGNKKFMPGGKMSGGYFTIGNKTDTVVVCEGFATGASIHAATGFMTVVAFSASNLKAVSVMMRSSQRSATIIIAGDNDESGTGQRYAAEAAEACNGRAVFPPAGDFNDMACSQGVEAVAQLINESGERDMLGSYEYSTDTLRPIEFCIDGFMANKVTVIAGPPGVGKTSLLVPMACIAAGLVGDESQIKATLRRRVAYVTEDPEQVERILYGMRKHGMIQCTDEEFRHWFDIIPAMRAPAAKVGQFVANLREAKTVIAPAAQNNYAVEPLIVLDTSNATLDLDNENDNSEAGKAIAAIKENLGKACLWVVAHTSKVASRSDIDQMSARGAGAFEGDANAVAYIINVENTRFMVLGKRRFECEFSEVRFDSTSSSETVKTPWGGEQKIWYRYGVPRIAEEGERASIKEQVKAEATLDHQLKMRGEILGALLDAGKEGKWLSTRDVCKSVTGKTTTISSMLGTLADNGVIYAKSGGRGSILYSSVGETLGNSRGQNA